MTTTSASASAPAVTPRQSIDEIDAAICRLGRRINAETYRLLLLVREFDERMGWAKWSFRSCAEWLAWRLGLSLSAAREHVRTAHALRELPAISAAFAAGRVSYSKVRALTRAARSQDEDLLLAYALDATAAQVEERCRQIRNVAPESVDVAQRAWERRSLSIWRNPARGTLTISVEVPIEEGEVIAKALDRAVAAGEIATGPEFAPHFAAELAPERVSESATRRAAASAIEVRANGWQAQQADALVAVAKAYLSGNVDAAGQEPATNAAPTSTANHYEVVVHVDESALRGGAGRSDLPLATVERLTCDGSVVELIEDAEGSPIDVGRRRRTVSTPLKRALFARDRGCTFPGCHRTRFVDAHHIRHWVDGGETSLENTTLLCTYHHRLLHEGGFGIRRDHDGSIYYLRPDGRAIPRGGYRPEDIIDAPANPSAEVREPAGVYRLHFPAALTG